MECVTAVRALQQAVAELTPGIKTYLKDTNATLQELAGFHHRQEPMGKLKEMNIGPDSSLRRFDKLKEHAGKEAGAQR
eukprot:3959440-Alexandrium_andersonii.AAC.1